VAIGAVNTWNGEGADPTLEANWTYENTPTDLLLTNVYQRFTIPNINIGTVGTTNVGVFIWEDDEDLLDTQVFYVAGVQLERSYPGLGVSDFVHRTIGLEKALCKRYFEKTFEDGVTPQQSLGAGAGGELTRRCTDDTNDQVQSIWCFETQKLAAPTILTYSPAENTNNWYNETDTASVAETVDQINSWGCTIYGQDGGMSVDDIVSVHVTAEAEL
jgi:hypothetical protein